MIPKGNDFMFSRKRKTEKVDGNRYIIQKFCWLTAKLAIKMPVEMPHFVVPFRIYSIL